MVPPPYAYGYYYPPQGAGIFYPPTPQLDEDTLRDKLRKQMYVAPLLLFFRYFSGLSLGSGMGCTQRDIMR